MKRGRWIVASALLGLVCCNLGCSVIRKIDRLNDQLGTVNQQLVVANGQLADSSEKLKQTLKDAQSERTRARRYLYVSQLTLADRARQEGQIGRMMQLLRSVLPESPEQEDLRRFEWYHLWRLHHGEYSRLRGHTGAVTALAFSPDDRLLASGSTDKTVKLWDTMTGKEAWKALTTEGFLLA